MVRGNQSAISVNANMNKAKRMKNDDFYTQLADIEKEIRHYSAHFRDKVVYCNCDDPEASNFFRYFQLKFRTLGLRKLITTCYKNQNPDMFSKHDAETSVGIVIAEASKEKENGDLPNIDVFRLKGDGDFRSPECVDLLKQADIVVTNPPFSLFREYVAQLVENDKKYIIIGSKNAITYRQIFPLIRNNKLWLGNTPMGQDMLFDVSQSYAEKLLSEKKEGSAYRVVDGVVKGRATATWFTNLDHEKRHENLILYRRYTPEDYPYFDNYDAISVNKTSEIPMNFNGVMGVPITFLDKHNPDQFEIVGMDMEIDDGLLPHIVNPEWEGKFDRGYVNNKRQYSRILIRNKSLQS